MSPAESKRSVEPIPETAFQATATHDGTPAPISSESSPEAAAIQISARGLTDQGRVRKNNEDSLSVSDLSSGETITGPFKWRRSLGARGLLLLVADGMGGQACGERASQMCCEVLPSRFLEGLKRRGQLDRTVIASLLVQAFDTANELILKAGRNGSECEGMGSTATAALLYGSYLLLAQVGDSRAYMVRNGELVQLTRDQTFLNYLVEIGAVDASVETAGDPRRSILTQAMGTAQNLQVAMTGIELCRGDRLVLVSDGLYSMVTASQLCSIAGGDGGLAARCQALVTAANEAGGSDNITVILADIEGDELPRPDPKRAIQAELLNSKTELVGSKT